jgi:chemotaxis protein histidine kinase CheA
MNQGGVSPGIQSRRLGASKADWNLSPYAAQEKRGKFPASLFGQGYRASTASAQVSWGAEEVEQAKKSALIISALIFLIQPLAYSGYYTTESNPQNFWEYGAIVKTPKLCTASQALCDERETNARIRAEADENRNRIWQQKFKGDLNLAKEDEEFDAGAKTWWGQRAKFKGLGAQPEGLRPLSERGPITPELTEAQIRAQEAKQRREEFQLRVNFETQRKIEETEARLQESLKVNGKIIRDKQLAEEKAAQEKKAAAEAKVKADAKAKTDAAAAAAAPPKAAPAAAAKLPAGWYDTKDPKSGKTYYYTAGGVVQWAPPTEAATPAKAAPAVAAPAAKSP